MMLTCMHAGREDLDVRMLGKGRPFVLEIADARSEMPSQQRLQALQDQLKASGIGVEVLQLQAAPKSILKILKVCQPYIARLPFCQAYQKDSPKIVLTGLLSAYS